MILAADIGGTNIRVAVVNDQGEIICETQAQMDLSQHNISEDRLISQLATLFKNSIKKQHDIKAIGIGFPGFFLGDSGVLVASPNLPELHNIELAKRLSSEMEIAVHIQNDALCAAIGEHRFGAGRGESNLLHITLGTGIGGGLILNNTPYAGESGMAMELGHLRVVHGESARVCGCGGRGCVEAYASATAIAEQYLEISGVQSDAKKVYELASHGDHKAAKIIKSAGSYLGMAIAEAVKLLDVHTITISGGLTGAWPMLHPAMLDSLDSNLIPPLKGRINILQSTLDDNAGTLGAATLVSVGES